MPPARGYSSVGRALQSHCRGQGFESPYLHHNDVIQFLNILRSEKSGRYCVGITNDLDRRLMEHNSGHRPSTRGKGPWVLAYSEEANSELDARHREREIKAWKSRIMIEKLLSR